MAAKKTGRYKVLRDHAGRTAGDVIDLEPEEAALLVRDGMLTAVEEA